MLDWGKVLVGLDYVWAAGFGILIGSAELVGRYRDNPWKAVRSRPGYAYLGVNALAALLALLVIRVFHWLPLTFGGSDPTARRFTEVLVAGLGSMALFRSSLFNIRIGDTDVPIGPSSILQIFVDAMDRDVDRMRGQARIHSITEVMREVSFEKAKEALPAVCLGMMQNLSDEDQRRLGTTVSNIAQSANSPDVKVLLLGFELVNLMGEDVVRSAVEDLADLIRHEEEESQALGAIPAVIPPATPIEIIQPLPATPPPAQAAPPPETAK